MTALLLGSLRIKIEEQMLSAASFAVDLSFQAVVKASKKKKQDDSLETQNRLGRLNDYDFLGTSRNATVAEHERLVFAQNQILSWTSSGFSEIEVSVYIWTRGMQYS